MIPYSLLELVRVREGASPRDALLHAQRTAICAEECGFNRIWIAEHHNFSGIASAATSVVISHLAQATKKIRVGAGGIMLPNHSPYVIAEQFGTLAHLFPGRIDLGLGRAPGTDQRTLTALRRTIEAAEYFPQDVLELQSYLSESGRGEGIEAVPAMGTKVPLWILGSSNFGAMLAAEYGLPYSFASHFAPELLLPALEHYRENFIPSGELLSPYAMVGLNVIAADTDKEALRLATTQQMSFADIFRGTRSLSRPPIDDIETYWSPMEKMQAMRMLACTIIGSPETIKRDLQKFIQKTGADELIIVSDIFEEEARFRSLEIISQALNR
jgi:luciferase family oxidoreductase group 1